MALLTTGTWHEVLFFNTNNAAWGALGSPRPAIPNNLIDSIVTGTPVVLYVLDAPTGYFAFEGGNATGFDDTLIDTSTPLTAIDFTDINSTTTHYADGGSGNLFMYNASTGVVVEYDAVETANFKASLP